MFVINKDCIEGLRGMADNSVDSIVTDPPYELSNDGKQSANGIFFEFAFPKHSKIESHLTGGNELALLINEIIGLSSVRGVPAPPSSVPVVSVALDNDSAFGEQNIEYRPESSIGIPSDRAGGNIEPQNTQHLGCFALKLTDSAQLFQILNEVGSGFVSGGLGVGFVGGAARLPSLLRGLGAVVSFDDHVGVFNLALADLVRTGTGAAGGAMLRFNLAGGAVEHLSAASALLFTAVLQSAGAHLVRAESAASSLPPMFESRRIRIINIAAGRALSLDLIVHPQSVSSTGFMGKEWDGSKIAYSVELWREALRVLKPGGHLLAFSGSRTYHRMTCAIEDAGFEIRDQIMWVYSQGFPKSMNLDREKGKTICGCDTLPYDHEETKQKTEYDLRFVRGGDVSTAISHEKECGEVLQQSVPEQSASSEKLETANDVRCRQSGMEGRSDVQKASWELRPGEIRAPGNQNNQSIDGQERWVCDGASPSNGNVDTQNATPYGNSSPYRSQSTEQLTQQSGTVAGQSQPQNGGAWPICRGCGKPRIPSGLGTALKPAHEPICVARKPLVGTVAANVLAYGTGAIHIDACRVATNGEQPKGSGARESWRAMEGRADLQDHGENVTPPAGRWPANLIHDGSDEVLAAFPDAKGQQGFVGEKHGERPSINTYGDYGPRPDTPPRGDTGSAARFFYCAKASKRDRDEGLADFPKLKAGNVSNTSGQHITRRDEGYEVSPRANNHPTVKPTDLMRYLCRLVTPPGGTVLDPFTGSGSTGKAALLEGFAFIGFELSAEYAEIANARIMHAVLTAAVNKS